MQQCGQRGFRKLNGGAPKREAMSLRKTFMKGSGPEGGRHKNSGA